MYESVSRQQVNEIAVCVNFWVDTNGEAHAVKDHVPWACLNVLKIKVPHTLVTEHVYNEMYSRGWMRVAVGGSRIMTEFFRLSEGQTWWLQSESNARKLDVADNHGRVIITPKEDVAESVVCRLLA